MPGDGGSAVFRAIADFSQLFKESRRAKKEMNDLGDSTERTNQKLGDTDKKADKASGSLGRLSGAVNKMAAGWKKFQKSDAGKEFKKLSDAGERLSGVLHGIRNKVVALSAIAVAATAAVGPVLGLVAGVVQLSGAVGLLPGVMFAGGVAAGVLKVAFLGVGDVIKNLGERDAKKFEDSIKALPEPMKRVARAAWEIQPALMQIKQSIQGAFWRGLEVPLKDLAGKYLPMVGAQTTKLAGTFNQAAKEFAGFLGQKTSVADINAMLSSTNGFFKAMLPAIKPLGQALLDVFKVSTDFLPELGKGITGLTTKFAEFIHGARESGKLKEWIATGLQALTDLGAALGNVGRMFVAIFKAGDDAGHGFFKTLREITDRVATFLESAKGQEALGKLFDAVAAAGAVLAPILEAVFLAFAKIAPILVKVGEQIGPGVVDLIKGLGDAIVAAEPQLIAFGKSIGELLSAIGNAGPLLNTIIQVVVFAAAPLGVLATLISVVAGWFAQLPEPVQKVIGVLAGFGIAGLTSLILLGKLASGLATFAGAVSKGITVLKLLGPAFTGVVTALRALGAAAVANPIIAIIVAIALIALLIILNWDTVKQWLAAFWLWLSVSATAAWNTVWKAVTDAMAAIVGAITDGWNAAWKAVSDVLTMILTGVTDTWNAVWKAVSDAITAVVTALTDGWNAAWKAVSDALSWIKDGVTTAFTWVHDKIQWVIDLVTGTFTDAWNGAQAVVEAVGKAIKTAIDAVVKAVETAVDAIGTALKKIGEGVSTAAGWVGDHLNPVSWFSQGGLVGGKGKRDSVPSMLTPGEYVVPAEPTRKFLPFLRAINPYDTGGDMATAATLADNVAGGGAVATRMAAGSALASTRAWTGSDGSAMPTVGEVNVNMVVNNPLPEKPSETASKRVGRAARLGMNTVLGGVA